MAMDRRRLLQTAASTGVWAWLPLGFGAARAEEEIAAGAFDFATVRAAAEELAAQPYRALDFVLPEPLAGLSPAKYAQIRYRPEQALWRDGDIPFRITFFHLGAIYRQPVAIHVVDQGRVEPVRYVPEMFEFGVNGLADALSAELGFAGLSLHHGGEADGLFDFARFHGASYFRIRGREQAYGLAARGLAVDTALPGGEEFPFFRAFWIERPAPDADQITVYALLDSPSVSGAYQFGLRPGVVTSADVRAVVFPRRGITKLGIAPLTSMFLFGENRGRTFDDFRPEVHNSDGLLIHNGRSEWLWRPLANHRTLQVSAFLDDNPRGFGLIQRDRNFAGYQDLQAEFQLRPSYWVEPLGDWGPGAVELVEIPSDHESNDNIVAFWVSEAPAESGRPIEIAYRLHAEFDQPRRPPLGRVEATRIGPGRDGGARRFTLDFAGGPLDELGSDAPLEVIAEAYRGALGSPALVRHPQIGGWRVWFDLNPGGEELCELRCLLKLRGEQVTETWIYRWTAP
jgi:glucans biosynthesis protein